MRYKIGNYCGFPGLGQDKKQKIKDISYRYIRRAYLEGMIFHDCKSYDYYGDLTTFGLLDEKDNIK